MGNLEVSATVCSMRAAGKCVDNNALPSSTDVFFRLMVLA
jgi:hypothetical protein